MPNVDTSVGGDDISRMLPFGDTQPRLAPAVWLIPIAVWGLLRFLLFEGIQGADDLEYLRFAWELDRIPANHWELRLPYNLLLAACLHLFGFSEFSAILPGLFGSLMLMIFCGLTVRFVTKNDIAAVTAMLIIALLPSDVLDSTIVGGPRILGTGMLAFALWCLITRQDSRSTLAGGVCFGLAVDCHLSLLFFIAVFFGTLAVFLSALRRRIVTMWLLGAALFIALDPLPWWFLTGDPLYRLHVIEQTHLQQLATDVNQRSPFLADGSFNVNMVVQPVRDFIISKPFAVVPVLMLFTGLLTWRRLPSSARGVLVAACMYWFYMSFGTHSPGGYKPFPGTVSYWQPLAIPLAIVTGIALPMIHPRWLRRGLTLSTAGLCLLLMSLSGKWGQNVEIAREFLTWAQAHPDAICITDDRTAREIRTLNAFETPHNLRLVPGSKRSRLWHVPVLSEDDVEDSTRLFVMINSLNDPSTAVAGHHIPDNAFSCDWLMRHASKAVYRTSTAWRPAAYMLPRSLRPAFMNRRPVSEIHECNWSPPESVAESASTDLQ